MTRVQDFGSTKPFAGSIKHCQEQQLGTVHDEHRVCSGDVGSCMGGHAEVGQLSTKLQVGCCVFWNA